MPLTFAVKDPDTNTTYKWKPASGVSELKSREVKAPSLTLGIEFDNSANDRVGPDDRHRQGHLLLDQPADPARREAIAPSKYDWISLRWRALHNNSPHPAASLSLGGDPPAPGEGGTELAIVTLPWRGRVGEPRATRAERRGGVKLRE